MRRRTIACPSAMCPAPAPIRPRSPDRTCFGTISNNRSAC
ncbi:hypothetical protein RB2654_14680 [Rhodobacterales bacterium HTCC2654]|uniref:Uncharacterized protein n=1 Tax=Maritimibacter alkaliphilus HTCC2654 TaxID=314271 RepID=A3VGY5_9RHOB|nr:hypothetical protein RB2654_14680 [Rhodobacterales bacterium HTCC2654] [Maritimibacter alkaliphilus HTCC2654]